MDSRLTYEALELLLFPHQHPKFWSSNGLISMHEIHPHYCFEIWVKTDYLEG